MRAITCEHSCTVIAHMIMCACNHVWTHVMLVHDAHMWTTSTESCTVSRCDGRLNFLRKEDLHFGHVPAVLQRLCFVFFINFARFRHVVFQRTNQIVIHQCPWLFVIHTDCRTTRQWCCTTFNCHRPVTKTLQLHPISTLVRRSSVQKWHIPLLNFLCRLHK